MKVYKFVTNGSAKSTGYLMNQVVERYYKDMTPYSHLSLLQVFDLIKNLPYRPDPVCTETLMRPSHTMNMRGTGGDCLTADTQVLSPDGKVSISTLKIGDTIMGRSGWVKVLSFYPKGELPVSTYSLSNGGYFSASDNHLCILSDGKELSASELIPGNELLQPLFIPSVNSFSLSNDDCKFIGLYLSDGWVDGNRVCISGKDGFPKEEHKRWVASYASDKGWKTSWHPRYIRVYIPLKEYIMKFLEHNTAIDKFIDIKTVLSLNSEQSYSLLEGLMSDSHQPRSRRSGKTFGSISHNLAYAVVLLYRKLGIGCTVRYIENHGGLGRHPIWRVYPCLYRKQRVKVECIKAIGIHFCYDIETEDHGIYLPDADIVVHNCDDKAIALASYARLFNIPYRFIAIRRFGRKNLHHVAVELYNHNEWVFCDPTYSFNTIGRKREEAERLILK